MNHTTKHDKRFMDAKPVFEVEDEGYVVSLIETEAEEFGNILSTHAIGFAHGSATLYVYFNASLGVRVLTVAYSEGNLHTMSLKKCRDILNHAAPMGYYIRTRLSAASRNLIMMVLKGYL